MELPTSVCPAGVSLEELARLVGGEVRGVCEELLVGITGIREARRGQITFMANPRYGKDLETTQASAVIVGPQIPQTSKPLLITTNPYLAYARIAQFFAPRPSHPLGISSLAYCGKGCRIGEKVSIYPLVFLGDRVEIEDGVILVSRGLCGGFGPDREGLHHLSQRFHPIGNDNRTKGEYSQRNSDRQ